MKSWAFGHIRTDSVLVDLHPGLGNGNLSQDTLELKLDRHKLANYPHRNRRRRHQYRYRN